MVFLEHVGILTLASSLTQLFAWCSVPGFSIALSQSKYLDVTFSGMVM